MISEKLYVLLVDDESDILDIEESYIEDTDFEVIKSKSGIEALKILDERHHEIVFVLSDFNMPEMNGLEFRRIMNKNYKHIPFALCSGYISKDIFKMSINERVCAFIDKPCTPEILKKVIIAETNALVVEKEVRLKYIEDFKVDAMVLIKDLDETLKEIVNGRNHTEAAGDILRVLHSLKGMATAVSLTSEAKFIGIFKGLLVEVIEKKLKIDGLLLKVIEKGYSSLSSIIAKVTEGPLSLNELKFQLEVFVFDRSVVGATGSEEEFDSFSFDKVGENFSLTASIPSESDDVVVSADLLDLVINSNIKLRTELKNLLLSVKGYDEKQRVNILMPLIEESLEEVLSIADDLSAHTSEMRLISVKYISDGLSDIVKDAIDINDKLVRINYLGADVKLDRQIINIIISSLEPIVTEIIEDCIESPEKRIHMDKPKEAQITIEFFNNYNEVVVCIEDDGRGVWAKENFAQGKKIIKKLKGSFDIKLDPGVGAKYTLRVPKLEIEPFMGLDTVGKIAS